MSVEKLFSDGEFVPFEFVDLNLLLPLLVVASALPAPVELLDLVQTFMGQLHDQHSPLT